MRSLRYAGMLFAFASLAGTATFAQQLTPNTPVPAADSGALVVESQTAWFVELEGAPVADGGSAGKNRAEKAAFRGNAAKAGLKFNERYAYDTLFNGLSIRIAPSQVSKLARIPGVKAIHPVGIVRLPETRTVDPDLFTALAMTGANVAQSDLGLTGAGVKVAVMDTGIDYNHPDLGGCFGPGCRVAMGFDFVGDAYDAVTNPNPVPDNDPDDCAGHGTHVAGIIGANGGVTGVAPGVTFGAYRVFGCDGSTSDDVMIAAMERIQADGMQVLNMSIGSAFDWPQAPTAMAATRLVNMGVAVVASIGNSGTSGLYAAGAPGLGEKVIGVASFDNTNMLLPFFTITPDGRQNPYFGSDSPAPAPTSGSAPMKRTGTSATANDACNAVAPAPGSLTGMVALIRRGTCSFFEKSKNAQAAGAIGVVLYNNAAGAIGGVTVAGSPAVTIPVVTISGTDGGVINTRLAAGPVTMTWTNSLMSVANPTGGLISSFSSYGLSPDLALKPDIGAPGGFIFSTFPLELGGYATLSGTSMSSPHVAGSVALLLEAKPHTSSQAVRGILQNTAVPKNWSGNPGLGFLDLVHRQGAGMLQIDKAILAPVSVSPAKISMGESEAGGSTQTLTLSNKGAADVTFDLSSVNGLTTGPNTFTPSFFVGTASVAFSAPSVTVPAGGSATVSATITPAAATASVNGGQYGGYIVLTPQGGGQVYRVPFAGFIGDYQSKAALGTNFGLPWLTTPDLAGPLPSTTVTMVGDDVAYFAVQFVHQARTVRMEIVDAGNGKAWHRAFQIDYQPRNAATNQVFLLTWDGKTTAGNKEYTVPNGNYRAVLSVLKALGDANNPAHWETWTSPVITIARP